MTEDLQAARDELVSIVACSPGPRAHAGQLTLKGDSIMVVSHDAYPADLSGLQEIAACTEALLNRTDYPQVLTQIGLVSYGRSPAPGAAGGKMVEDNSVWATKAAFDAAKHVAGALLANPQCHVPEIPMAFPACVRHTRDGQPLWIRPPPHGHYVAFVVLSDRAGLGILPLPQDAQNGAHAKLQHNWFNGKKPIWGKPVNTPMRRMVFNAAGGQLWTEVTAPKTMHLDLERGDMVIADPSTAFIPYDKDTLLLTFYVAETKSPQAGAELWEAVREQPLFDPETRFPDGRMVTYGSVLKAPWVVTPGKPVFPPFALGSKPGEDDSLDAILLHDWYEALKDRPADAASLSKGAQRVLQVGRFWASMSSIKHVHLTKASEALQKTRTTLSNRVTTMSKKDLWSVNLQDLQDLNDAVVACARDIQAWQAEKTLPPAERFLNTLKAGLADMEDELRARGKSEINKQLDALHAGMTAPAPDWVELQRLYTVLATEFNPNYKGDGLPMLPLGAAGAAGAPISGAPGGEKKKASKKKSKGEGGKEQDLTQDPRLLGFALAKTFPPPASESTIVCKGCDADAIPMQGRFCADCCAEAATALAKHVLGAGLIILEERNPTGLAAMKPAVMTFREQEAAFRSMHENDGDVTTMDDQRRTFVDLLRAFIKLQEEFQTKYRINLENASNRHSADEVDDAYSSADMMEDDDDDDEDEDMEEDEDEDEDEDDEGDGESEPEDGENCSSSSSLSEKRPIKKSKAVRGGAQVVVAVAKDDDDDDDKDLEDLVVDDEDAEREEREIARKRRAAKAQKAPKAAGIRDTCAQRVLYLEMTLPGEAERLNDIKRRWFQATEDVEWQGLLAEMKRLEDSWAVYYVLEAEITVEGAKGKRALVTSVGPWNDANKAALAALEYTQKHLGLKAKVVEKKRSNQ